MFGNSFPYIRFIGIFLAHGFLCALHPAGNGAEDKFFHRNRVRKYYKSARNNVLIDTNLTFSAHTQKYRPRRNRGGFNCNTHFMVYMNIHGQEVMDMLFTLDFKSLLRGRRVLLYTRTRYCTLYCFKRFNQSVCPTDLIRFMFYLLKQDRYRSVFRAYRYYDFEYSAGCRYLQNAGVIHRRNVYLP